MYQEYFKAIPLLIEGEYKYNIDKMKETEQYWKEHKDNEMSNLWKEKIKKEQQELNEQNRLTLFGKIIKKLIYKS